MANRRRRGSGGAVDVIALVTNYGGRKHWRSKDVCRWEYDGSERRARELGCRVEIFALSNRLSRWNDATSGSTLPGPDRGVLLGFSRKKPNTIFIRTEFCVASVYFPEVVADQANFHGFFNVNSHSIRCIVMGIAALLWWHLR